MKNNQPATSGANDPSRQPRILIVDDDALNLKLFTISLSKRGYRVLLAMDGSEPALRAARLLASWRGWLGDLDVQIVYAQPPLSYLETVLPPHGDVIRQWSTQEGESATQAARELFAKEGIRNHLHLTLGDAATEIIHSASDTKCELLVLGTRGLGAAHHALIGSVALKAAAHAAMPVVLVK